MKLFIFSATIIFSLKIWASPAVGDWAKYQVKEVYPDQTTEYTLLEELTSYDSGTQTFTSKLTATDASGKASVETYKVSKYELDSDQIGAAWELENCELA